MEAVGALSGFLSRQGTAMYAAMAEKPALSPPGIVFPIVWTVLFALMGIGGARVAAAPESKVRSRALNVFVVQLVVNFFWSLIFFNAKAYGFAFVWLLLLWVTFAGYLNFMIWRMNME